MFLHGVLVEKIPQMGTQMRWEQGKRLQRIRIMARVKP
jgi:hypothetical protein